MDKVLSIIAEYNPFHNGHLYQLQKSLKDTGSNFSIAIMSGNFTQRGSVSIVDKWTKAKMALLNGIDLVIELPLIYSISSAENFADGAIKILSSLNIINYLSFGAECSNLELLDSIASILYDEPSAFKELLANELKNGLSFPKARENALISYCNGNKNYAKILSSPNNILAIEYLKALKKYKSAIIPYAIQRIESEHNSNEISGNIASSSAIRAQIKNNMNSNLEQLLPSNVLSLLQEKISKQQMISDLSVFEKEIIYKLRLMSIDEIKNLPDVCEGLEFALKNAANSCNKLDDFFSMIQTKRYTRTRIQRILLYSLIDIHKEDMALAKNMLPYVRVLGFNDKGKYLVSKICKNSDIELVTSVKKYMEFSSHSDLKLLLKKDILATNIYTMGYASNSSAQLDYTNRIIHLSF